MWPVSSVLGLWLLTPNRSENFDFCRFLALFLIFTWIWRKKAQLATKKSPGYMRQLTEANFKDKWTPRDLKLSAEANFVKKTNKWSPRHFKLSVEVNSKRKIQQKLPKKAKRRSFLPFGHSLPIFAFPLSQEKLPGVTSCSSDTSYAFSCDKSMHRYFKTPPRS